ncbi:hypothetical protein [Nicoliella lavandulae]|uniref:Uncharacterized protein n=1 Tax=Nicoliella lavandulae TaxID=3082954 RepID=A0ABU8SLV2_9LACO
MKKTILYLATLAALTSGGVAVFSNISNNEFGTITAHAGSGSWLLLHPLDSETAKYIQPDSIEGAVLTDAGQALYNDGHDSSDKMIFSTAPYIRDSSQVDDNDLNTEDWVGQIDTITFTPKDNSVQPITVTIVSIMAKDEVTRQASNFPEYISQLSSYYSQPHELLAEDERVMREARSLELAGIIPTDSRIQSTLNAMDNSESATSNTTSNNNQTNSKATNQSNSNPANKNIQKLQANLKRAAKNLKNSQHKSKHAKQVAKQKYNKIKKALKSAKQNLK